MKLLVLTNNPSRPSFRQRIEIHLNALRRDGIDCEVTKFPSGELVRLRLFRRVAAFDAVFLQKKCLNFFDAICLRRYSREIIYDFDDAIMYSPEIPESDTTSHFRLFQRTVRLADMVIAGNSYLAEHARKFNPNVEILPTGLDTSSYKLWADLKNDGKIRLVWIGSSSTLKYLADIKPAFEEIGERFNNVILRIICDEFFDLQNLPVEKRLWSQDTESLDLATSDIGLAPLPDNRFTRGKCGFKILQYACAGLPVIASPVGTNSDYVHDNVTGFLATDTRQWVDRITQLIENPQLREKMGQEGRAFVQKFDVSVIGKQLAGLVTKCLQDISS